MDPISLYTAQTAVIDGHYDEIKKIIEASNVSPEGNCFYYHDSLQVYPELINKRANLLWLASQPGVNKVLEIGLNAGHSAVLLMLLNNAQVTFFDIGTHAYMQPCYNYLKSVFPTKSMDLILGDSRQTLGPFTDAHEGEFDLVHVDGGHIYEVFSSDFAHALRLVRVGGVIVVDDTNIPYIHQTVNEMIAAGKVEEVSEVLYTTGYQHRVVRRRF